MTDRRATLLQKSLQYLVEHGLAGLSLRPLAAAVGTSARLLVYHFGSKEQLLVAVMDEARARSQEAFAGSVARGRRESTHPLEAFWNALTVDANLPYLRLLFEVQALALHDRERYGRYLEETSGSWLEAIERLLPEGRGGRAQAALYVAVVDGLLLELLSSGDRRRAKAALRRFIEMEDGCTPA